MAILNNYKKWKDYIRIVYDKYWDFVLSRDNTKSIDGNGDSFVTDCLISFIDFSNPNCIKKNYFSSLPEYKWENSLTEEVTLLDAGLTCLDNGTISLNSGDTLIDVIQDTTYVLDDNGLFCVIPVKDNTNTNSFDYEYNENEGYIALKGGFLQGFFKLDGFNYQTLPHIIEDEWNIEMTIRPKDYETKSNTLNAVNPDNKGIFFYIGTRAENKFALLHNKGITSNIVTSDGYSSDDESVSTEYTVTTDNKFLVYNRTKNGCTVNKCDSGATITLTGNTHGNVNLFPLLHRGKNGYTVNNIDEYYEDVAEETEIDMLDDIKNNAFALKLNDDGSISYRYFAKDCDSDTEYSIIEESTVSGLVSTDEWHNIMIKFKILNGHIKCETATENRKMKIYIYVDGYLKLVSKELDDFNFRALNEKSTKQECVPFNISIGGGSQGLANMIWPNYIKENEDIQYIEKNYAGSFIGDIKTFRFYNCQLQYSEIKNNSLYEI